MLNSYVYFMAELSNVGLVHRIKVGVATNPRKRLSVLQTGNSRELELLFTIGPMGNQMAYEIERQLHSRFAQFHLRGEWFKKQVLRQVESIDGLSLHGSFELHSEKFQLNWKYGSEEPRYRKRKPVDDIPSQRFVDMPR